MTDGHIYDRLVAKPQSPGLDAIHIAGVLVDAVILLDGDRPDKAVRMSFKAANHLHPFIDWDSTDQSERWLDGRVKPTSLREAVTGLLTGVSLLVFNRSILDQPTAGGQVEQKALKDAMSSYRWWMVHNETDESLAKIAMSVDSTMSRFWSTV